MKRKAIRKGIAIPFVLAAALALSACEGNFLNFDPQGGRQGDLPYPTGEIIGSGPARIALLLPLTAPGNGADAANEILNGARMAQIEFGGEVLQLIVKDNAGQVRKAQADAGQALREGVVAIFGPLFAPRVESASAATRPAGRTMIAYSTDSSVARRGVYLFSFTPQDDTERIIRHAIYSGKRSILAMLPDNPEGTVREAVLREEAGDAGIRLRVLKYRRSSRSIDAMVRESASILPSVDTLYIPEGGSIPDAIMKAMRRDEIDLREVQILGSGAWEELEFEEASLEGALYPGRDELYPGRDETLFEEFARHYEELYGLRPGVHAALGYDSVVLAIDLVNRYGPQRAFQADTLETSRGFSGVNGIFRFRSDGTVQRGLAIYRIESGEGVVEEPAPQSFSTSTLGRIENFLLN